VLKVAVIGSGPSGHYVTEGLLDETGGDVEIDVLDRLPTPYGLVRGGIAPDHQSTKAVTRRFARLHAGEAVRFFGNLGVGENVSVAELRELYDAIVLAVGAPEDRALGLPGEDLPGVFGSARFVGWYNAHPDFVGVEPNLECSTAVVIGNGNVAIDVARVLTKTPLEMAHSDLPRSVAARIHNARLCHVYIVGRRGPLQVGFTPKELGELGELAAAMATVDANQLPSRESARVQDPAFQRVIDTLYRFSAHEGPGKAKRIHFRFFARPLEILGDTQVRAVRFERTELRGNAVAGTGERFDIPCGLVVSCIGYRCQRLEGVPFDDERGVFSNIDGVIEPGLYCAGWARRGPTGTVGSNRPDGFALAREIAGTPARSGRLGRSGLQRLIAERSLRVVNFAGWNRIDAAEVAAARPGAPREKMLSVPQMLQVASV
jgi:ferredoxin--NADP+ reductase